MDLKTEIDTTRAFWTWFLDLRLVRWSLTPFFKLYVWLIAYPTSLMFEYGPWYLGGYENREHHDICHQITGYRASTEFWKKDENLAECERMIFNQFMSFMTPFHYIVYAIVAVVVVRWAIGAIKHTTAQTYEITYTRLMRITAYQVLRLRKNATPKRTPKRTPSPRKNNSLS